MKTIIEEEGRILAPGGSFEWYFWEEENIHV